MRNRILPFGLIPALLGSVLMFATAELPAQETAVTTPETTTSESTTTQTVTDSISTTTKAPSTDATAGACSKSCMDASGNLQTCKIVNSIPKYTCANPTTICSGACF
ncbi:hypothetical protein SAMN02949497_0860 [Methylomagnum ishizawai]|uniref:Uncharacterized protein n=1 Tax=Methylomagnum ishizawai TaxID=1760988 RepID=A0A1Y6CYD7_9GAMM|nr:hypothetical protein [Methylomagnum ishizawai]SMF93573.1 hypothetical protein SAMN02949497_0860 [Methylomagnum ishizawai]